MLDGVVQSLWRRGWDSRNRRNLLFRHPKFSSHAALYPHLYPTFLHGLRGYLRDRLPFISSIWNRPPCGGALKSSILLA
jgi:hypothetical protein